MTNTNIITTNNLCKNYGVGDNAVRALKNCNIKIHTGESMAVTGTSGSGKSTFLTLVGGITTASDGEIVINGKNITSMSEKELAKFRLENIGFVFQAYNLIPEMTAYQNIILPLLSATQNAKSGKPRDKPKLGGINQHKADCYAVCCVSQVVYPARCAKVSCQKNRCVFAPIFLYLLKRRSVLNNRFELF